MALFRRERPAPQWRGLSIASQRIDVRNPNVLRALTAAARSIDTSDRVEARRGRALRQGWQSDAWTYRDAIGELRYATEFLANCVARMRFFAAAYPTAGGEEPVALDDMAECPDPVKEAAAQAISDLGVGLAIRQMAMDWSRNTSVAGECFLLGREDPQTGRDEWSIRSVDEIVIRDDKYQLREIPSDPKGQVPWVELDADSTTLARIWTPHPRFKLLADSPLKAILDDCEALMILRRMIRAAGRSRLAGAGLLGIPNEITIAVDNDDDSDPVADPFTRDLTRAMTLPISDEGVASAVVPIVIRGPAESLDKIVHIKLADQFADQDIKVRAELLSIIATSIDLPKEVLTGIADLNHWSAWQVDDNTFRHHVEPHVILGCDGFTAAYLRPRLQAFGVPPEWIRRIVLWYDPTELVTHPDRAAEAKAAYDAMAISGEAYRRYTGFTEADAPEVDELESRRLWDIRALPLNLLMEYARRADPTLIVPPITQSGEVPGIKPGAVDTGPALPPAAPNGTVPAGGPDSIAPPAPEPGPPPAQRPLPRPITASAAPRSSERLSRKLSDIDRDLRARLQAAANAAMLRALERAGARLRSKVAKDETLRTKIAHRANERVPAILGPQVVTAAGLAPDDLLGDDWAHLRTQFHDWTKAAQSRAVQIALQLGSLDPGDEPARSAQAAMDADRDRAWQHLSSTMTEIGQNLLYNPDPNTAAGDWGDLSPSTLVPAATVRATLAVAGGSDIAQQGTTALIAPAGQIGTGQTIGNLLTSAGAERQSYEWHHASTVIHPFSPHEALDGVEFEHFDDDVLRNTDGQLDVECWFPGDHPGCLCDAVPLWVAPA